MRNEVEKIPSWKTKSGCEAFLVQNGRSNVFLIRKGETGILIDSSVPKELPSLKQRLEDLGMNQETLKLIFFTHGHMDHLSNGAELVKIYGSKVICQEKERREISEGYYPLPKGTVLPTKLMLRFGQRLANQMAKYPGVSVDMDFSERFSLEEYGIPGYLLFTPGHTKGSASLILDNELAFVGDAMFGIFPNRVLPPFADEEEEMVRSWKKLLNTGCDLFFPSHGTVNTREVLEKEYLKYRRKYSLE